MKLIDILNGVDSLARLSVPSDLCEASLEVAMYELSPTPDEGNYDLWVCPKDMGEALKIANSIKNDIPNARFWVDTTPDLCHDGWILTRHNKAIYSPGA